MWSDWGGEERGGRGGGQLVGSGWRVFDSHAAECHKLPFTDALHQRHQVVWFYLKFLNVEPSDAKQQPFIYLLVAIIV